MKYLKTLLTIAILTLSVSSTIAQDELYKKYSGKEGVTKVYISEVMFSLFKGVGPMDINVGNSDVIDIGQIMKSLTGLYILSCDNKITSDQMEKDFNLLMQDYELELLMEVEDNSDIVKMYITREEEIIKNFFMKVKEDDGGLTIMYFKGNIPESDLAKIINAAK